jgi:putative transposase
MPRLKLFYHFVWATKYRRPMISPGIRDALYGAIVQKAVALGGVVHAINGMDEHVHLVVEAPASRAISSFIGQIKGASSHSIQRHPSVALNGSFEWQTEYSVDTVSERALPDVIRYVENQQRHHAQRSTRETLERW